MKNFLLTIALAVLAFAGAGTRASAQTAPAKAQAPANVQAVDLGLPSGLKWASCNIGATAPEDYGNYYAWGETAPKADYSWATYKYANGANDKLTKYCTDVNSGNIFFSDNKTVLEPEDDAAHVNWGGGWRMPTAAEVDELIENCILTWTMQNGVNGIQVSSKTNSNSIFLPAAGRHRYTYLNHDGSFGYYWSASLEDNYPFSAWYLNFYSDYHHRGSNDRAEGFSIRPVQEKRIGGTGFGYTAIAETDEVRKVFRNGQVLIERNGKTYTATGVEVK